MTLSDVDATALSDRGYCPGCGYDLRGSRADRCPECGLAVSDHSAQLPWERRHDLGRIRSFVRTAWLATAHPGRLSRMAGRHVHAPSARRFRWIVVVLAATCGTATFVALTRQAGGIDAVSLVRDPRTRPFISPVLLGGTTLLWSAGATLWPVLPIGLLLVLSIGTQWDHWLVLPGQPPAVRQRAMAGARYTVAPLLGLLVLPAFGAAALIEGWGHSTFELGLLLRPALIWAGAVTLLVLTGPARYALALPGGGVGRAAVVLAGTAVQWAVAIAVGLGLFPLVIGLLWVMVDSLL